MLAATQYIYRYNQVSIHLYWNKLRDLQIKVSESWLKYEPSEDPNLNSIKVLWDSYIITDKKKPQSPRHRHTQRDHSRMYDYRCGNTSMQKRIQERGRKNRKYRDLGIELQKFWNLKEVWTIPVVIKALDTVTLGLTEYLKEISPNANFNVTCQGQPTYFETV